MTHNNPDGTPKSRGPLRTMFLITSMPVGGAEVLLLNLLRRLDRSRVAPELCCLKELGPLGEELAGEIPAHHHQIGSEADVERAAGYAERGIAGAIVGRAIYTGAVDIGRTLRKIACS